MHSATNSSAVRFPNILIYFVTTRSASWADFTRETIGFCGCGGVTGDEGGIMPKHSLNICAIRIFVH